MSKTPVIAIVDDDEAVREAISELLEVTGFASRCFDRADALLADPAIGDFDCIISDVRMPGIDGIELQQRLRGRGSDTPVIFITAAHDPVTRSRAFACGAHAFLTKPIADDIILAHLKTALNGGKPSYAG